MCMNLSLAGVHLLVNKFMPSEHGGKKFKYYCRRVDWDVIDTLVHVGWSANVACNCIYKTYSHNQSVMNILNRMLENCGMGGHPNL
jgi:hypothetical protein